jgi:hypothetical protein
MIHPQCSANAALPSDRQRANPSLYQPLWRPATGSDRALALNETSSRIQANRWFCAASHRSAMWVGTSDPVLALRRRSGPGTSPPGARRHLGHGPGRARRPARPRGGAVDAPGRWGEVGVVEERGGQLAAVRRRMRERGDVGHSASGWSVAANAGAWRVTHGRDGPGRGVGGVGCGSKSALCRHNRGGG